MNTKYLIEINQLNLYIEKIQLTSNISLAIRKGRRIGITGPSGCGKSSLLKAIISKEFSTETIFNKFEVAPENLLSYMPQSNGLLPWFSLKKNFEIFSKGSHNYEEIVRAFNLSSVLDSFSYHLSGGEYQRAILAAAIINKPDIFLADEPLTEIDISRKWKLLYFWSKKIKEFDASLLLVSHDLETLLYLCDKVLVLSDKPSQIKKEIIINAEHPRELNFLFSQKFLEAKSEMLNLIN